VIRLWEAFAMIGRAALVLVGVVACRSGNDVAAGSAASRTPLERCVRASIALGEALAERTPPRDFVSLGDLPFVRDLACADLYRQPTCASAWRDAFAPAAFAPAGPDARRHAVATIAAACAAAYCPRLAAAPTLALCSGTPDGATLDQFDVRKLDAAILSFEGVDEAVAPAIAGRVGVVAGTAAFFEKSARAGEALPDPVSLVVTLDNAGQASLDGHVVDRAALSDRFASLARQNGQLVIQSDPSMSHQRVIELMEQAKQAGVVHLAFGTTGD
jgi:hypothetical protein